MNKIWKRILLASLVAVVLVAGISCADKPEEITEEQAAAAQALVGDGTHVAVLVSADDVSGQTFLKLTFKEMESDAGELGAGGTSSFPVAGSAVFTLSDGTTVDDIDAYMESAGGNSECSVTIENDVVVALEQI
ncbi:MAG: hypothetical protein ACOYJB_03105 [Christensenellaceae bacterium]|jgi:hypothetical protein